jgi:hypothetical protein
MPNLEKHDYTHGVTTVTDQSNSAASVTATVASDWVKQYGLVAFSGGSTDQAYKVEVKIAGVTKITHYGAAGTTAGLSFAAPYVPHTSFNEALSVVTTPDITGKCVANMSYIEY